MIIRPDDQVLDYGLYQQRIGRALTGVEQWKTGYPFWLAQGRKRE